MNKSSPFLKCTIAYKYILFILFLFQNIYVYSQKEIPYYTIVQKINAVVIDGLLDDSIWGNVPIITEFKQYDPVYNTSPTKNTAVKLYYTHEAIYIGAIMVDSHPDSIQKQIANRDDDYLNADFFGIQFDTYNNQQDAYTFSVSASGVQSEYRIQDFSYNAVWQSEVKITKNGWSVEIKIPWSALRFPTNADQIWGMQIFRSIRRNREKDLWALEDKSAENNLVYWGKLNGFHQITSPVRLSFVPYFGVFVEHFPHNIKNKSNYSYSINGGLDLKYGINNAYTLDMMLLPDFSQVQSDNLVKNITAFETVYDEKRPFFQEAVDLFSKGDLFYTRRIGSTPLLQGSVSDSLRPGEQIEKNPETSRLINATKISGRNQSGLAIGFFNAITGNTYAKLIDTNGNKREILTNPLSNYNIIVLDKTFRNNSSFYFTNTNVIRDKRFNNANVTATGLTLGDKTNNYKLLISGAFSQIDQKISNTNSNQLTATSGYKYGISIAKIKGNFQFSLSRNQVDDHYDCNDLGIVLMNNRIQNELSLFYKYFQTKWILRDFQHQILVTYTSNYLSEKTEDFSLQYKFIGTTTKYLTLFVGYQIAPFETYDYYEPRTPGRYVIYPQWQYMYCMFSSDYRKPLAIDGNIEFASSWIDGFNDLKINISPIIRLGNKTLINYSFISDNVVNMKGYVMTDTLSNIIFARRNIETIENIISYRYMFRNNLSINFRLRHYWSKGVCLDFYALSNKGVLYPYPDFNENHDFSFNSINVDIGFNWEFLPGSSFSVSYKNAILNESKEIEWDFSRNFQHTLSLPQLNSLSIKLLYYLDYISLKKKKSKVS